MDKNMEYISRTQTLVGTKKRQLIDVETGEKIEVDQITKRVYGQKAFWKLYLMDFLQVLGIVESKQVNVLIYLLENTEPANNTFIGSQREIATSCKVSLDTVSKIMVKLQEVNFIKKIQNGVYQISANIMMKGSDHKKQLLLNYYDEQGESSSNE